MAYLFILILTIVLSPFLISTASKQNKKSKSVLKNLYLLILASQLIFGFFNWETFAGTGKTGFGLALAYPQSLLWTFFAVSAVQIVLLLSGKNSLKTAAVVLSFCNSILFFVGLIRISNIAGSQIFSIPAVIDTFLVLIGNVVGLVFINKDKNLLSKLPWS